jgi:hypothetical protein
MSRPHISPEIALACTLVMGCSGPDARQPTEPTGAADQTADATAEFARFDPTRFVSFIDNPLFPLRRGTRFVYVGREDGRPERDVVDVTRNHRIVDGVRVIEVLDRVFVDGSLAERTRDWYAQDEDGNVWYLGEDSKEIEDGTVVSTEGSWEAGKDGAKAGIIMPAHPRVGHVVRQEFAPGVAEDKARYLNLDVDVAVPFGEFDDCLKTEEFSPLEPGVREFKFYCRGIGMVKEREVAGGTAHLALTAMRRLPRE